MVTPFKGSPFTAAIIRALEDDGLIVGDGEAPAPELWGWQGAVEASPFVPYVVVHAMVGGVLDGSMEDPDDDGSPVYQLSAHGITREQCEWVADTARRVMLHEPLPVAGQRVVRRIVDMLGGARRDDEAQPPLFVAADRYRLRTTPDPTATGS